MANNLEWSVMMIILIGLWMIPCYFKINKWKKRKKRCTQRIQVQVVKILSKRPPRGSDLLYKPIFKVCSIKQEVIIDSALYTNLYSFEIGQIIWIDANPIDLQDFIFESPYSKIIMFADMLGVLGPLFVMVVCLLFTI